MLIADWWELAFVATLAIGGIIGLVLLLVGGLGNYRASAGVAIGSLGIAGLLTVVAILGAPTPIAGCVTSCGGTSGTPASFAVSFGTLPTGATYYPASETIQAQIQANTTASAFCLHNTNASACPFATASTANGHGYLLIPITLSRTDFGNFTAGATLCLNNIPTLIPPGGSAAYSWVGYTAATTSSGGIWKVSWTTGSLAGANPTQNAPAVTSGVGCNTVGVPAFGSKATSLVIDLGGANSTGFNFETAMTLLTNYPLTLSISGAAGTTVTPTASYTIEAIPIGIHS